MEGTVKFGFIRFLISEFNLNYLNKSGLKKNFKRKKNMHLYGITS